MPGDSNMTLQTECTFGDVVCDVYLCKPHNLRIGVAACNVDDDFSNRFCLLTVGLCGRFEFICRVILGFIKAVCCVVICC